jgi:hypothetical protein
VKPRRFELYQRVMAGLVPAIHEFHRGKDVDARHKAGHDDIKKLAP